MLEAAGEALGAGAGLHSAKPAQTGVFVGISWTEYARMAAETGAGKCQVWWKEARPASATCVRSCARVMSHRRSPPLSANTFRLPAAVTAYTAQGAVLSVCPGRVAYHYGLKGPAVAVDTACSSSLVALNSGGWHWEEGVLQLRTTCLLIMRVAWDRPSIPFLPSTPALVPAREAILGSSSTAALAGGINMMLAASTTFMFKRAGMLSADGRCKALDKSGARAWLMLGGGG